MKTSNFNIQKVLSAFFIVNFAFLICAKGQTEIPPKPSAPRATKIPLVTEGKLSNGLKIATVQRTNVPLVTVQLLVKTGANGEETEKAGLANLTAAMLTKGTKTRTATQIAEQIEFLGATIASGAGWNNSVLTITGTSDKIDAALAIMADAALNPKFDEAELNLLKSQTLDGLAYNLTQPGFLASYVASKYSFEEHPAGGTPESIEKISVEDIATFKKENYLPEDSVLIFSGDITSVRANALAQKHFKGWRSPAKEKIATEYPEVPPTEMNMVMTTRGLTGNSEKRTSFLRRLLVVDLPDSGQASVNYTISTSQGRVDGNGSKIVSSDIFYPALVFNSVLGGGYSSRLNQEIRIKRGLSYGAGSSFAWRSDSSNFSTRTQTDNKTAAEVAELVLTEIQKMFDSNIDPNELAPRKLVLTGDFGRELETTAGLANAVAALYTYDLPLGVLRTHIQNVNSVTNAQIRTFANSSLKNGDMIIVGDYKIFKDDLAKRFPNMKIEVIKADELDMSSENLRK
jgi:zinc protease